jgi:hypothetical protein
MKEELEKALKVIAKRLEGDRYYRLNCFEVEELRKSEKLLEDILLALKLGDEIYA